MNVTDVTTTKATPSQMPRVANAFALLGWMVKNKGRRLDAAYAASRARVRHPEQGNSARTTKMAPRAERRARVKELRSDARRRITREGGTVTTAQLREQFPFRPVLGHAIPAPDHKLAIAVMKTKDLDIAADYLERSSPPQFTTLASLQEGVKEVPAT